MQSVASILLALVLAHLLGDFVLQSGRMLRAKRELRTAPYLGHGAVHYLLSLLCLAGFARTFLELAELAMFLFLLALLHLVVDAGRAVALHKGWISDGTKSLVVDQAIHLALLAALASLLTGMPIERWVGAAREAGVRWLPIAVLYLAVVFAAGPLVQRLLRRWEVAARQAGAGSPSLPDAGRTIGWLERFLVLTAILAGAPTAVGLVVAAKSIFRFPEIKGRPFAEYFLIGTLLSVSTAVAAGVAYLLVTGRWALAP